MNNQCLFCLCDTTDLENFICPRCKISTYCEDWDDEYGVHCEDEEEEFLFDEY